jgi:uncharacterized HAD superfamily protein
MIKSVGVDIDGVLYDWHRSVYDWHTNFKNYTGSFNEFWTEGVSKFDTAWWEYTCSLDILYSDRPPVNDCLFFLNNIKDKFEIYYITSRPECVKTTTEQYLKRYKLPFRDNLILTDDKVNVARRLKLTYAIDDLPAHVEALSKITKVFMMAKPWNIYIQNKYITVKSLTEILNLLED